MSSFTFKFIFLFYYLFFFFRLFFFFFFVSSFYYFQDPRETSANHLLTLFELFCENVIRKKCFGSSVYLTQYLI